MKRQKTEDRGQKTETATATQAVESAPAKADPVVLYDLDALDDVELGQLRAQSKFVDACNASVQAQIKCRNREINFQAIEMAAQTLIDSVSTLKGMLERAHVPLAVIILGAVLGLSGCCESGAASGAGASSAAVSNCAGGQCKLTP